MKRLTETELNALRFVDRNSPYSPESDHLAEPGIVETLKALKRKKRIYAVDDADVLTYRLTQAGRNELEAMADG